MTLRTVEMIGALFVTAITSVASAWLSKSVMAGERIVLYYLVGIVSSTTWLWMLRRSPWSPLTSSVAWDVAYSGVFSVVLILVFGTTSPWQVLGIALVVAGLILLGI